jgi:hypothetical protein
MPWIQLLFISIPHHGLAMALAVSRKAGEMPAEEPNHGPCPAAASAYHSHVDHIRVNTEP